MSVLRILVVEDDKHIRRILESLLTKEPSLAVRSPQIVCAADGQDGMLAMEKGPYDLVITDLLMPRMDGFQFCRELRKHRFGEKVPVIVTSAIFKDHAAQIRIRQAVGDHHFFAKPYEMRDLVKTVNRIFDGGKPPRKDPTPSLGVPILAERPESGSLAERAPARVLLDLSDRKASGTLGFTRGKVKKEIGLQNGVITSCDSNLRTETLGHFLVSRGVIDEAKHQTALGRAQAQKERLGQALIELGWINEADLLKQLGAQMRAKVASMLRWNEGGWSFVPGAPPAGRLQTPVEAPKLVFLGLQKTAHVDEIAQLMAAVRGRVALTSRAERHRETFTRVFGTLGLEALARRPLVEDLMSFSDPGQMLIHLDALLTCGLAEIEAAGVAQRAPNEATDPAALERITQPAAPAPTLQKNLYDALFTDEPSEVKSMPPPPVKADAEALRKEILTEYLPLATRNHYQVLGVAVTADRAQIAAAHASLMQRFRLERFTDAELGADYAHVEELHQAFTRALETLGSGELRADYDRLLTSRQQPSGAPIDAELCASQAEALLAKGDAAGARARLETAVASAPDEPHYRALLAWATFLAAGGAEPRSAKSAAKLAQPQLEQALALITEGTDSGDAHDFAGRIAAAAGDDERAIAHLERALDAQPQRAGALTALEAIYFRKAAWKLLERRYRKLIHRLGEVRDPLRVSLWTKLAALYQERLGDAASAKVANEVLAKLTSTPKPPPSPPTKTTPPPLPTKTTPPPSPPADPPVAGRPPEALFAEHVAAERWDAALVAASACAPADTAAAEFYRRYRPRFLQRAAPLDAEQLAALRHPDDDPELGQLFAQLFAVEPPAFALGDLGVGPNDLLAPAELPSPFARALAYAAALVGVTPPPLYRRGDFGVEAKVGAARPVILIVGPPLLAHADLFTLAFRLGRALALSAPDRASVAALPSRQLKDLLLAALTLVTPNLKVEDADGGVAKKRAQLAATAPQLARDLTPLVGKLLQRPQGALNLTRYSRGIGRSADRLALVACNDPGVALRMVTASGVAGAAEELTRFVLSEPYLLLREQLGISVAV